jgi:hypothetical protein
MGSDPSFIKIASGIQKLIVGIHIQTHRQKCDVISLVLFYKSKESRPKFALEIQQDWCQLFKKQLLFSNSELMNGIIVVWQRWSCLYARRKEIPMKQELYKLALSCKGRNMRRLSYIRLNIIVSALMKTRSQQSQWFLRTSILSAITAYRAFVPYFSLSPGHTIILCVRPFTDTSRRIWSHSVFAFV